MNIIVSDIEGTLTTGSSWQAIRTYYKAHFNPRVYNRFFSRWIPRYLLVKLGLQSRRDAMFDWMLDEVQLFKGMSPAEFDRMAQWVVETEMWPKRRRDVLAALEDVRGDETQILVVSSAYQPIVAAFARRMDAVPIGVAPIGVIPIGSHLELEAGCIVGITQPLNAYEHKAAAVLATLEGQGSGKTAILAAYGDTASDIPMMEISSSPVAVYPDPELRRIAETRGWQIIG
jgi:phosphoserine phosphatase